MQKIRKNICNAVLAIGLAAGCVVSQSEDEAYSQWKKQVARTEEIRKSHPEMLESLEGKLFDAASKTNETAIGKKFPDYPHAKISDLADMFKTCGHYAMSATEISDTLSLESRNSNPVQRIIKLTEQLLDNETYINLLHKDFGFNDIDCKAHAVTSTAVALKIMKNSTNAPAYLELITGIAYHEVATNGMGHMWMKAGENLIDSAITYGNPKYVPLVGVKMWLKNSIPNKEKTQVVLTPQLYCITPDMKIDKE
ncbi:hypothetical protein FJZ18_01290 [Candidatus Pacearchaeota archaeon]|nr:hypothetical protein [Candidatus Pacearchaeota archaeon]